MNNQRFGTMSSRPCFLGVFAVLAAFASTACVDQLDGAVDEDLELGSTEQAASASCILVASTVVEANQIQNKGVCGMSSEYITDSINTVLGRIDTTRVCEELTYDEKSSMCGEDFRYYGDEYCWLSRVVAIRTDVYFGSYGGCGSGSNRDATTETTTDSSDGDWLDSPDYVRTDGCGFDAYGRWRCQ